MDADTERSQPSGERRVEKIHQMLAKTRPGDGMSESTPDSPCVNVCKLDQSNMCTGCGRLLSEIAAWSRMTIEEQRAVCEQAGKRLNDQTPTAP